MFSYVGPNSAVGFNNEKLRIKAVAIKIYKAFEGKNFFL